MTTRTRNVTPERVLDAMRSGEWLRSQWITRVACNLGDRPWQPDKGAHTYHVLKDLERQGLVEHRDAEETRRGELAGRAVAFVIPRGEWRLNTSVASPNGEERAR